MTALATVLCLLLVALALLQALPALLFARALLRSRPPLLTDEECPKAAVLLSLRGPDPFLAGCLTGLLTQDYPHYDVRIVVDHPDDPAWEIVNRVLQQVPSNHVHAAALSDRLQTCTGKACGLLQAAAGVDESYEVVAILDADTVPHATWLRELVAPLRQQSIGVASGNRWFMPQQSNWGSLVRYAWNAAAVVVMYFGNFTWGGSVAIRGQVLHHSNLKERWRHAVASDTAIYGAVRQLELHAAFVPSLMMINRETCTLREFFAWVRRQLLVGRLQHQGWWLVLSHGAAISLAMLAAMGGLLLGLATGQRIAATWLLAGIIVYQLILALLLALLEVAVRSVVRLRREETRWTSLRTLCKLLLALPLTQLLYAVALPTIGAMRDLTWRGVVYRVDGPWAVRLIKYQPFKSSNRNSTKSLT